MKHPLISIEDGSLEFTESKISHPPISPLTETTLDQRTLECSSKLKVGEILTLDDSKVTFLPYKQLHGAINQIKTRDNNRYSYLAKLARDKHQYN